MGGGGGGLRLFDLGKQKWEGGLRLYLTLASSSGGLKIILPGRQKWGGGLRLFYLGKQ